MSPVDKKILESFLITFVVNFATKFCFEIVSFETHDFNFFNLKIDEPILRTISFILQYVEVL